MKIGGTSMGNHACQPRRAFVPSSIAFPIRNNARNRMRSHGVVVSTQDFEFCDPGSNPGGTFLFVSSVIRYGIE